MHWYLLAHSRTVMGDDPFLSSLPTRFPYHNATASITENSSQSQLVTAFDLVFLIGNSCNLSLGVVS